MVCIKIKIIPCYEYDFRNCLKFEIAHKFKKITPALEGVFLIFRAPFRVWGNPKNQNEREI
jgi:hypothetical protein